PGGGARSTAPALAGRLPEPRPADGVGGFCGVACAAGGCCTGQRDNAACAAAAAGLCQLLGAANRRRPGTFAAGGSGRIRAAGVALPGTGPAGQRGGRAGAGAGRNLGRRVVSGCAGGDGAAANLYVAIYQSATTRGLNPAAGPALC